MRRFVAECMQIIYGTEKLAFSSDANISDEEQLYINMLAKIRVERHAATAFSIPQDEATTSA